MVGSAAGCNEGDRSRVAGRRRASPWRTIRRAASATLDLIYPPCCVVCGGQQLSPGVRPVVCAACTEVILTVAGPVCRRCGSPIPSAAAAGAEDCPRCRDRNYDFQAAVAMGVYRDELRDTVLRLKRGVHEPLALALGSLLAGPVREGLPGRLPDLVVPMPMHWRRRLVRGGNCTEVLVESLSRELGRAAAPRLLLCRRKAKKQATLPPSERFQNVRGAFGVRVGYDIGGAHVLLVDDVMTTGATASEAARMLRRAGASRVSVAVVARGVGLQG